MIRRSYATLDAGIVEPIRTRLKEDVLGLGKKEQEDEMAEVATKRKALEIEIERTEEEKKRKLVGYFSMIPSGSPRWLCASMLITIDRTNTWKKKKSRRR